MRTAGRFILGLAACGLAMPAEAATLARARNGAVIAPADIDAALAQGRLAVALAAGERLAVADQHLLAESDSRALISLSTEFLTVAVTHGRLRFESGPAAASGQALLLALDGSRVQRLGFDATFLSSTLSAGARPLLAGDLGTLARAQRRRAFWGVYTPLRVNARAQGDAATEDLRTAYLSDPAIVRQRRAAAGIASVETRARHAAEAFLESARAGDVIGVAALLDPAPFLALGGAGAVEEGRRRAAQSLLADPAVQPALASARIENVAADGSAALLTGDNGRWRLVVVPRDRAIFIAALEPAP